MEFQSALLHGCPWKSPSKLVSIKWHPTLAVVTVGSDIGEIYTLILETKILKEIKVPTVQKHPVWFLCWANENQLLSLNSVMNILMSNG